MIKETSSNQPGGRDSDCKMVRFLSPSVYMIKKCFLQELLYVFYLIKEYLIITSIIKNNPSYKKYFYDCSRCMHGCNLYFIYKVCCLVHFIGYM